MRRPGTWLWIALLTLPLGLAASAPEMGTLLVANRTGGSISLFDIQTAVEMARVPIGPAIPHEVAVSPDGRVAMTGAYGPNDDPGSHLVVIDVAEGRAIGRIDLPSPSRPHSATFLPGGRRAVATMEQADQLALVDVANLEVLRTYPTGGREGHMVRLSPDGSRAYVTSRGAAGTLSVIALDKEVPPVVIETGKGAEGLAVSPDGAEVWVVNRLAETISVVDTRKLAVIATIEVPPNARRAEISRAGRVLVPHAAPDGAATAQYLSVYDLGSRTLIDRVARHEGRTGPGGFGILLVDEWAFASDRAGRSVLSLDLADAKTVRVFAENLDDPDGLAYSPVRLAALQGETSKK